MQVKLINPQLVCFIDAPAGAGKTTTVLEQLGNPQAYHNPASAAIYSTIRNDVCAQAVRMIATYGHHNGGWYRIVPCAINADIFEALGSPKKLTAFYKSLLASEKPLAFNVRELFRKVWYTLEANPDTNIDPYTHPYLPESEYSAFMRDLFKRVKKWRSEYGTPRGFLSAQADYETVMHFHVNACIETVAFMDRIVHDCYYGTSSEIIHVNDEGYIDLSGKRKGGVMVKQIANSVLKDVTGDRSRIKAFMPRGHNKASFRLTYNRDLYKDESKYLIAVSHTTLNTVCDLMNTTEMREAASMITDEAPAHMISSDTLPYAFNACTHSRNTLSHSITNTNSRIMQGRSNVGNVMDGIFKPETLNVRFNSVQPESVAPDVLVQLRGKDVNAKIKEVYSCVLTGDVNPAYLKEYSTDPRAWGQAANDKSNTLSRFFKGIDVGGTWVKDEFDNGVRFTNGNRVMHFKNAREDMIEGCSKSLRALGETDYIKSTSKEGVAILKSGCIDLISRMRLLPHNIKIAGLEIKSGAVVSLNDEYIEPALIGRGKDGKIKSVKGQKLGVSKAGEKVIPNLLDADEVDAFKKGRVAPKDVNRVCGIMLRVLMHLQKAIDTAYNEDDNAPLGDAALDLIAALKCSEKAARKSDKIKEASVRVLHNPIRGFYAVMRNDKVLMGYARVTNKAGYPRMITLKPTTVRDAVFESVRESYSSGRESLSRALKNGSMKLNLTVYVTQNEVHERLKTGKLAECVARNEPLILTEADAHQLIADIGGRDGNGINNVVYGYLTVDQLAMHSGFASVTYMSAGLRKTSCYAAMKATDGLKLRDVTNDKEFIPTLAERIAKSKRNLRKNLRKHAEIVYLIDSDRKLTAQELHYGTFIEDSDEGRIANAIVNNKIKDLLFFLKDSKACMARAVSISNRSVGYDGSVYIDGDDFNPNAPSCISAIFGGYGENYRKGGLFGLSSHIPFSRDLQVVKATDLPATYNQIIKYCNELVMDTKGARVGGYKITEALIISSVFLRYKSNQPKDVSKEEFNDFLTAYGRSLYAIINAMHSAPVVGHKNTQAGVQSYVHSLNVARQEAWYNGACDGYATFTLDDGEGCHDLLANPMLVQGSDKLNHLKASTMSPDNVKRYNSKYEVAEGARLVSARVTLKHGSRNQKARVYRGEDAVGNACDIKSGYERSRQTTGRILGAVKTITPRTHGSNEFRKFTHILAMGTGSAPTCLKVAHMSAYGFDIDTEHRVLTMYQTVSRTAVREMSKDDYSGKKCVIYCMTKADADELAATMLEACDGSDEGTVSVSHVSEFMAKAGVNGVKGLQLMTPDHLSAASLAELNEPELKSEMRKVVPVGASASARFAGLLACLNGDLTFNFNPQVTFNTSNLQKTGLSIGGLIHHRKTRIKTLEGALTYLTHEMPMLAVQEALDESEREYSELKRLQRRSEYLKMARNDWIGATEELLGEVEGLEGMKAEVLAVLDSEPAPKKVDDDWSESFIPMPEQPVPPKDGKSALIIPEPVKAVTETGVEVTVAPVKKKRVKFVDEFADDYVPSEDDDQEGYYSDLNGNVVYKGSGRFAKAKLAKRDYAKTPDDEARFMRTWMAAFHETS